MLGAEKRTRTNDSEHQRLIICYPLRVREKTVFKQPCVSG